MTQANDQPQPASAAPVEQELGLAAERDAVLRQLDDRTNQTWAAKRERWAALVRAQDAEIQRLRTELAAMTIDRDLWADQASQRTQDALDLVTAERERCAKLCDLSASIHWGAWDEHADPSDQGAAMEAERLAGAIRGHNARANARP